MNNLRKKEVYLNELENRLFIGNIYKVTKRRTNCLPESIIKNRGIGALMFGEVDGSFPSSILSINDTCEIYKDHALLVKISDDEDIISEFAEVLGVNKKKLIIDRKNTIISVPFALNCLFVDEKSIEIVNLNNEKKSKQKLVNLINKNI